MAYIFSSVMEAAKEKSHSENAEMLWMKGPQIEDKGPKLRIQVRVSVLAVMHSSSVFFLF